MQDKLTYFTKKGTKNSEDISKIDQLYKNLDI